MNGDQIREARERRGWTQEQLAKEVGVGARTIGNWERGETVPQRRMGRIRDVLAEPRVVDDDSIRSAPDSKLLGELLRRAAVREHGGRLADSV